MIRYYITDRRQLGGIEPLLANIERQILAGVDWIQLREKDLSSAELLAVARKAVAMAGRTRILINSRMDVAIAAGAHGIHLPSSSPSSGLFKRLAPQMTIGVSCHNRSELLRAEAEGADFAVLSPVFAPLSKSIEEPSLGLEQFASLVGAVRLPVLALGGITEDQIPACLRAGAAGIAGISLFQTK